MMVDDALQGYLAAQSGIAALVGDRIYPVLRPPATDDPCITFALNGVEETFTADEGQTDYIGADIQVDAWGATALEARTLAAQVRDALQNFRGTLNGVQVDAIHRVAVIDVYESTVERHRRSQIFTIWHTET